LQTTINFEPQAFCRLRSYFESKIVSRFVQRAAFIGAEECKAT